MFGVTHVVEIVCSATHIVSLSVAMGHLAESEIDKALLTIAIGCLCFVVLTTVYFGCEVARWKLLRYIRKRQLVDEPESKKLQTK